MNYPHQEFLADYLKFSEPLFPIPEKHYFQMMKAFFEIQYGAGSPVAEDRCRQMRKALALITNSEKELEGLALTVRRPAKVRSLVKGSLLLAAHELVNVRGFEQPTIAQLKEVLPLFEEPGAPGEN